LAKRGDFLLNHEIAGADTRHSSAAEALDGRREGRRPIKKFSPCGGAASNKDGRIVDVRARGPPISACVLHSPG